MKVYHGEIVTVDAHDTVFAYLVEDGGVIVYVGNELPAQYAGAETVELNERALVPAFADTHQHFASFALFNAGLNVMEVKSNREMLRRVAQFAAQSSDKLLIAFGASPYSVEEGRLISREELDEVCPDRPLVIIKYDGHACVVNTRLLRKIEKKVRHLRGCHPDTGEMNQEAFFAVSNYLSNSISVFRLIKNMQRAADYEASHGIGLIHSVSCVGFPLNLDLTMEQCVARRIVNAPALRLFAQSMDTRVATRRRLPRIGGCFACALDGCFGSQDAAMLAPYDNDKTNSGVLYYTDEQVADFCKRANRLGLQIELHAIGDRAFEQAADALKAALDDFPRDDHRHGIIHACLPTARGLEICKVYHICFPMQIAFDNWRQEPAAYTGALLGATRNAALNPVKTIADMGCTIAFGSDGPCTDPDPVVWLAKAVNHSNPEQAVSVQTALRMCTYNGCLLSFDEQQRGSLEVGKRADMVILSQNPYTTPKEQLYALRVEQLLLSGRAYQKQTAGALSVLLGGLLSKKKT